MWRIIRYGLLLWIIGVVITIIEVRLNVSRTVATALFYTSDILFAFLFFGIFFSRAADRVSAKSGLVVGVWWILINLVLSALFFWFFYGLRPQTFISWHTLAGTLVTLMVGMFVAHLVSLKQQITRSEGRV